MNLRPEVERFIRKFETCQLKAYQDRSGRWTIGYGWQGWFGPPVPFEGMTITKPEADELFHRAILGFGGEMQAFLRAKKIEVNDWQYSALMSLAYNKGMTTFARSEVVHHLMNVADPLHVKAAQVAFTYWGGGEFPKLDWMTDEDGKEVKWLMGLHRRRQSEGAIFDGVLDPHRFDEVLT